MEGASSCGGGSCMDRGLAVGACAAMAFFYVALLYLPSFLLRLPPPASLRSHMLRRFVGAISATCLSLIFSYRILVHVKVDSTPDTNTRFTAFGIHPHHWWQAITFPLLLTSLLYLGPLTMTAIEMYDDWREGLHDMCSMGVEFRWTHAASDVFRNVKLLACDVLAWRNFVLAPLTEEIVFRACMIPLLLCAGLQLVMVIFLCPLFFGLAHANHFWELVHHQNCDKKRAALIVGAQLGYTTVFGWYAAFLYLRTGNLLAPLSAHVFCNIMGFPDLHGVFQRGGLIFIFVVGVLGFGLLLAPASHPQLYSSGFSEPCYCWLGYCKWR